ncbi:ligand-dependent corepressor isoform X1 [Pimephales promelas]|uniref:ligand-dependent corepressor isoform X1 n=1 Tax=Pimephales promelas TaxID=90988 RepID=UPI001955661A|nr:ligand-dependent corepressor isoform X1 [Pimephales promelas]KAG1933677.1 ligand-dependent nuclear receptor corepressor-like protein [Pimephales promelas]
MASLCRRQQCTIERRGFRQELDSWRHKLIHCVGFESILEGLFGPGLVKDLTFFQDCEPEGVSDWSFNENCLFCCLRREKVKENLVGLNNQVLSEADSFKQDQSNINKLERQAEDFLNVVFYRKADLPKFTDPHIPLVAREIMQRMIRQFAAEYTSKTSSTQDVPQPQSQPNGTKDQSLPKAPSLDPDASTPAPGTGAAASAQNPVLSKLLMADQDSPLDLTIKKPETPEPSEQDGVLDLSTKKNHSHGSVSMKSSHGFPIMPTVKGRSQRADHNYRDVDDEDGLPPRSLHDGIRENCISSGPLKPPLARSLLIKEELLNQKHRLLGQPTPLSLASLESVGLLNSQAQSLLSRDGSWGKSHLDSLLKLKQIGGNLSDLSDLPLFQENLGLFTKGAKSHDTGSITVKKEPGHSPPVDLKIPQVRGMDLSWDSHGNASDLYSYSSITMGNVHSENALSRKLRVILPKQSRRAALGGLLDAGAVAEYWGADLEQPTLGPQYPTSDPEADPTGSKQPRKKRGRYRQYNTEILEEAIAVVMGGKMSVSKAQNIYGIPHSTLEYKVKERMGTLKNPPKKKLKLMMRAEGQDSGIAGETESTSTPATTPVATPVDLLQGTGDKVE